MNINWYPGHMVKAFKQIQENLSLVDVVIEIVDARIPQSSRNPQLNDMVSAKPRIIALNKSDLSDSKVNDEWIKYYKKQGFSCLCINSWKGVGINEVLKEAKRLMSDKVQKSQERGRIGITVKTAIVGVPNSGKSSFINRVLGRNAVDVADRPGVTKTKKWITAANSVQLLDTPGLLWPKFENEEVALNLAYTGAIKSDLIDIVEVSIFFIDKIKSVYKKELEARYKLDNIEGMTGQEILDLIAKKRGCIVKGGELDLNKAATMIIDEFQEGKIGKLSLERPEKS